MPKGHDIRRSSLEGAVRTFEAAFRRRHPDSRFLIDGEGYEDEDLDLNIYVDGDQTQLEQDAVAVSHEVEEATGYFILPFVLPASAYPGSRA